MKKLWEKIDDLKSRARRNNLVLYNIPEGTEQNADCIQFLKTFSREFLGVQPPEFQRAHHTPTGPVRDPGSKPRPIHILMPTFQAKLSFRKAAIDVIMHPSKETLNSPSSRVDADSTSRRRRILRCIFSGVGES